MYSDGSIARVPSLAAITLKPPKLSKILPPLARSPGRRAFGDPQGTSPRAGHGVRTYEFFSDTVGLPAFTALLPLPLPRLYRAFTAYPLATSTPLPPSTSSARRDR